MIRFTCPHCDRHVRIPDRFGGKKGRCPFCKATVHIPAESEAPTEAASEGTEMAGLAAALGGEPAEEGAPPPPPHALADVLIEEEAEAELPAPDPRDQTDRLDAIVAEARSAGEPQALGIPLPPEAAEEGRKRPWVTVLLIAGGVVLLGVVAGVVVIGWRLFQGPESRVGSGTTAVPARVPKRPVPAPAVAKAKSHFELSGEITVATARAPAGSYCMFHVDLLRATKALAQVPGRSEATVAAIAASRLWSEADKRIAEGSMPTSATLFLTGQTEPIAELFAQFHGMLPGGRSDPGSGLWALTSPESRLPHFLVRLTGPATKAYSAELLARAAALGLGEEFPPDQPAARGTLRLSPAGMFADQEMLVGTARTLSETGMCVTDTQQLVRLRKLLMKVRTDRPVVGCVVLAGLRNALQGALGQTKPMPTWTTGKSKLIFSIDPRPAGLATICLCDVTPDAATQINAEPMIVEPDGPDVRITGVGTEGIPVLAKVLPGFRDVLLKGLAMADPVRSRVAAVPAPRPADDQPEPVPPEPAPPAPPEPAPVAKGTIHCVCFNSACPTRKKPFEMDKSKIPAEALANALAGSTPIKCPHCGKPTAVVAVKCPHCGKYTPITGGGGVNCEHCGKPLK